jgi:hypothetical protein
MMRARHFWIMAAGLALVVSGVSPGRAFEEPDGFGKAKFGTPAAEVKKLYPKMQLSARPTPKPDQPQFPLTTYTLGNQAVGPLKKCNLAFEFYLDELFEIQFRCPDEDEKKITAYLTNRFGDPKPGSPSSLLWQGTKAAVTYTPQGKVFAFGDIERTKQETMALLSYAVRFGQPGPTQQVPIPQAQATPEKPLIASELLRNLSVLGYADPDFGIAPLTVHFTVQLFEEVDEPLNPKFSWDFDDESPRSHDREPTHVYTKPGKYKARVRVTDANDKSGADDVQVYVIAAEPESTPAPTAPAANTPVAKQEGKKPAH